MSAIHPTRHERSYSQNETILNHEHSQNNINQSNISDQYSRRDFERSGSDFDQQLKQSIYDKINSIKKRKEQIRKTFRQSDYRSKTSERIERIERTDSHSRKRVLDQLDR